MLATSRKTKPKIYSHSLHQYENRLKTFDTWPTSHIIEPSKLALAGFYYYSNVATKCAYCLNFIGEWSKGDDPDLKHKLHYPSCSFVQKVINPRLQIKKILEESTVVINDMNVFEEIDKLGLIMHKRPYKPDLVTVSARLRTFLNWPKYLLPSPDDLANAGFYYTGVGDEVFCFYCAGGIKQWEPTDDPWIEHAKYYSKCNYILLTKGEDFVKEIVENVTTVDSIQTGNDIVTNVTNAQKYEENIKTDTIYEEERILVLEEENRNLKESHLCKICMDKDASVLFLPCKHLAVCPDCVLNMQDCPVCRKPIKILINAYL